MEVKEQQRLPDFSSQVPPQTSMVRLRQPGTSTWMQRLLYSAAMLGTAATVAYCGLSPDRSRPISATEWPTFDQAKNAIALQREERDRVQARILPQAQKYALSTSIQDVVRPHCDMASPFEIPTSQLLAFQGLPTDQLDVFLQNQHGFSIDALRACNPGFDEFRSGLAAGQLLRFPPRAFLGGITDGVAILNMSRRAEAQAGQFSSPFSQVGCFEYSVTTGRTAIWPFGRETSEHEGARFMAAGTKFWPESGGELRMTSTDGYFGCKSGEPVAASSITRNVRPGSMFIGGLSVITYDERRPFTIPRE